MVLEKKNDVNPMSGSDKRALALDRCVYILRQTKIDIVGSKGVFRRLTTMSAGRKRILLCMVATCLFLVANKAVKDVSIFKEYTSSSDFEEMRMGVLKASFQEFSAKAPTTDSCTTATDLVFVKTHKTAGSTVGHVLGAHRARRGLRQKAKAFPAPHFGGYPIPFQKKFTILASSAYAINGSSYFLSGHMRFQEEEIRSFMSPTTKYITILRDPLRVFESAFYFYYGNFKKFIPTRVTSSCEFEPYLAIMGEMGANFSEYIRLADGNLNKDMAWYFRSKNFQSHDLGLDPMNDDEDYTLKRAYDLDSVFDLVMITDYFLESLILLKDTLCMEWEDLISPNRKEGTYEYHEYSEEEREIVKRINKQDVLLYDYFNNTLWKRVEKYGHERMAKDIETLKQYMEMGKKLETEENPTVVQSRLRPLRPAVRRKRSSPSLTDDKYVDQLVQRIYDRSSIRNVTEDYTRTMAREMVKYAAWCPY